MCGGLDEECTVISCESWKPLLIVIHLSHLVGGGMFVFYLFIYQAMVRIVGSHRGGMPIQMGAPLCVCVCVCVCVCALVGCWACFVAWFVLHKMSLFTEYGMGFI